MRAFIILSGAAGQGTTDVPVEPEDPPMPKVKTRIANIPRRIGSYERGALLAVSIFIPVSILL